MKPIKRLYLLGPMTGIFDDNRPAFNAAAAKLRSLGFDVVNPAELDDGLDVPPRVDCYARDIPHLLTCDAGVGLPGWRKSTGASLEAILFVTLERPIFDFIGMRQYSPEELPSIRHPNLALSVAHPLSPRLV